MILKILNIFSSDTYSKKAALFLILDVIEKELATIADKICHV